MPARLSKKPRAPKMLQKSVLDDFLGCSKNGQQIVRKSFSGPFLAGPKNASNMFNNDQKVLRGMPRNIFKHVSNMFEAFWVRPEMVPKTTSGPFVDHFWSTQNIVQNGLLEQFWCSGLLLESSGHPTL